MDNRTPQEEEYLHILKERIINRSKNYLRLCELRLNPDRDTMPRERADLEYTLGYFNFDFII